MGGVVCGIDDGAQLVLCMVGPSTPTSITCRGMPAVMQSAQLAAWPRAMALKTVAVSCVEWMVMCCNAYHIVVGFHVSHVMCSHTCRGYADTWGCCRVMPWSAAKMSSVGLRMQGRSVFWMHANLYVIMIDYDGQLEQPIYHINPSIAYCHTLLPNLRVFLGYQVVLQGNQALHEHVFGQQHVCHCQIEP